MDRHALRGFLAIGFFVGGTGFLLAYFQPRESGEFIVSICSGFMGFALIGLILLMRRLMQ